MAKKWIRNIGILIGAFILLWLPAEDISPLNTILISAVVGLWLSVWIRLQMGQKSNEITIDMTIGTLVGVAVPVIAVLLMVFKSGIHGHVSPDFSNQQLFEVLTRAYIWGTGGLLIGLGIGLWQTVLRS